MSICCSTAVFVTLQCCVKSVQHSIGVLYASEHTAVMCCKSPVVVAVAPSCAALPAFAARSGVSALAWPTPPRFPPALRLVLRAAAPPVSPTRSVESIGHAYDPICGRLIDTQFEAAKPADPTHPCR